jgi:hypothetical protein
MAESKSGEFPLTINANSEKFRKFDVNPVNRLADISEWRKVGELVGDEASLHVRI